MAIDLRRAQPRRRGLLPTVFAICLGLFAVLTALVAAEAEWLADLDHDLGREALELVEGNGQLIDTLRWIEDASAGWPRNVFLVLVAGWLLWRSEWRLAAWVTISSVVVVLGNRGLKEIIERSRPEWDAPVHSVGGWAFPSGHAAGAGLVTTILVLLTFVLTGRGPRRRILVTVWVLFGLLVGLDRILLGVHHTSDVVAGGLFGVTVTLGLWLLIATDATRVPAQRALVTGTGRRRAAVVLNPSKVGDVAEFTTKVRHAAALHQWVEPIFFETTVEDPGYGQAVAALEAGVDLIIAAGGDGTVRAVCEEAARTGVAVAIIPQGTGNLLARNLAIPLNLRDALDVAFSGQDRAIDLSRFRTDSGVETSFLVMAGLGMDAMIMTGVNPDLKQKVGWLAYFVSGVKAVRFPGMKVEICVDDQPPRKFRARTVVIGNVGFLQGGIPLLPDAEIDDGQLDVIVIAPRRLLGWLSIVWRVVARRKKTNDRLDRMSGAKVVIRSTSDVPMQLDGDPVGEGREITAEVRPGVLLVRVPVNPGPRPGV